MNGKDSIKKNISKNLVMYRTAAGLSQKEFAEKLGVGPSRVSNWESGTNSMDINMLLQICNLLNVSINDMYGIYPDAKIILSYSEQIHIEKYRSLDPHGQQTVNIVLDRELDRTSQAKEATNTIEQLQQQLTLNAVPSRFFAYYGKIAAAGTSVEFSDITAGVRVYPENELNKNADYVIGVSGSSMEPEYSNGDIVYVQKTDYIDTGDIGIFQKGNNIYIKKAGENELISLNPNYPLLTDNGDRIIVLGKVLGKAEEI